MEYVESSPYFRTLRLIELFPTIICGIHNWFSSRRAIRRTYLSIQQWIKSKNYWKYYARERKKEPDIIPLPFKTFLKIFIWEHPNSAVHFLKLHTGAKRMKYHNNWHFFLFPSLAVLNVPFINAYCIVDAIKGSEKNILEKKTLKSTLNFIPSTKMFLFHIL